MSTTPGQAENPRWVWGVGQVQLISIIISILKCELYNLLNLSTFLKIFKILKNYTISLQKYSSFLYHYHRFILTPSLKSL